ncbi:MAG: hypothetical protein HZB33_00555 [Nitrospirae bacterium]|nr:hypothetical protein [Nitrospirota bacterium]
MSKGKIVLFAGLFAVIMFISGMFVGKKYYQQQLYGQAIWYWMMGVDSLKKHENDYALLYLSQATGIKDDPMFYESLANAYEINQNDTMALFFYKLALKGYQAEKNGPIKKLESKVLQLETSMKK